MESPGICKENCYVLNYMQKKAKGQTSTSKDPPNKGDHASLNINLVMDFSSMNTNVNVMQDDTLSWWNDSRATRHVCKSKQLFKTLHKVVDGDYFYMVNNLSIKVHEKWQVELLFTSGNLLVLRDVYYDLNISRNLVTDSLLSRLGYRLVFESDRCISSRSNIFLGRAYLTYNLFKLSLLCNYNNYVCNVEVLCNTSHDTLFLTFNIRAC